MIQTSQLHIMSYNFRSRYNVVQNEFTSKHAHRLHHITVRYPKIIHIRRSSSLFHLRVATPACFLSVHDDPPDVDTLDGVDDVDGVDLAGVDDADDVEEEPNLDGVDVVVDEVTAGLAAEEAPNLLATDEEDDDVVTGVDVPDEDGEAAAEPAPEPPTVHLDGALAAGAAAAAGADFSADFCSTTSRYVICKK